MKKNIDWSAQPLGEMPDWQIAKLVGVKRAAVMRARIKRGIKPFRECSNPKRCDPSPPTGEVEEVIVVLDVVTEGL